MRLAFLVVALFAAVSVGRADDITSRELVGTWTRGIDAYGQVTRFSFRADHSFDFNGGDIHWAGKWKLQRGNKLELITHYDYDPKPISGSSPREWMIIESIDKGRMRYRRYYKGLFDDGYRLSGPQVLTKRR